MQTSLSPLLRSSSWMSPWTHQGSSLLGFEFLMRRVINNNKFPQHTALQAKQISPIFLSGCCFRPGVNRWRQTREYLCFTVLCVLAEPVNWCRITCTFLLKRLIFSSRNTAYSKSLITQTISQTKQETLFEVSSSKLLTTRKDKAFFNFLMQFLVWFKYVK